MLLLPKNTSCCYEPFFLSCEKDKNCSHTKFFKTCEVYLGCVVSKEGIQADTTKINAIHNWPMPTNVSEAHSFLGFANYYHHFIKGYAKVAQLL